MSTLDSALELARASIPVFPVELTADNKKRPLIKWRDFASTDPETARQLFSQDYQLGQGSILVIGVPTGTRSGFDAVDIDPRHGGDVELYHETLPDTRWHDTRQGGRHYLFNHLDGMRNSTSKIEPAIDVRGEDGFIVWWPAHGGECHTALIADWPGWLAEMATKPRTPKEGAISLDLRKPPSACHVVDLLNAMQNRLETTRDTYVEVMLAAKGCIDALDEAGELTPEDDLVIADAATGWAERWEGASETDEGAKWDNDWSHRDARFAGWQTLIRIAADLAPDYRTKLAAEEFNGQPAPARRPYRGNPHWPSMLHQQVVA